MAAVCTGCGVDLEVGVKFCSNCGTVATPSQSIVIESSRIVVSQPAAAPVIRLQDYEITRCAHCGKVIDASTQQCPNCGSLPTLARPTPVIASAPKTYVQSPIKEEMSSEARTWAMLCHLAAFGIFIFPAGGNLIGPLIAWVIKKDQSPFVDQNGKEVLNFQLSFTLYAIIAGLSMFVLIGFILLPLLSILFIVCTIIGAIRANSGGMYRYPLTIRMLK